jgi:alkylation response protein AidB-like acyl-CoA dehydrogenase
MTYLSALDEHIQHVLQPLALRTDVDGRFPREMIDALGRSGLLGLASATCVGGLGLGLAEASAVVKRMAQTCPSTAMVVCMHYCATVVLEQFGHPQTRKSIAQGTHLSTLAFSETASRSHFWAPAGTAYGEGDDVLLDANKSWVTSAFEADSYVWSSKPLAAAGASTLWLVDARLPGLTQPARFDGLGLRGNASTPIAARRVRIRNSDRLGEDGKGFEIMMGTVLPWFTVLSASCSVGLMEGAIGSAIDHVSSTRLQTMGASLAELPTIRAQLARARIRIDVTQTLLTDTIAAIAHHRPDTMIRVLEVKAAAAEAALDVTDTAMRVCGGAAFRKEVGIERLFRDARAASVMAPTSDLLYDFLGKAITGQALF